MKTVYILSKSTPDSLGRHRNQTLVQVCRDKKEVNTAKRRHRSPNIAFTVTPYDYTSTL